MQFQSKRKRKIRWQGSWRREEKINSFHLISDIKLQLKDGGCCGKREEESIKQRRVGYLWYS